MQNDPDRDNPASRTRASLVPLSGGFNRAINALSLESQILPNKANPKPKPVSFSAQRSTVHETPSHPPASRPILTSSLPNINRPYSNNHTKTLPTQSTTKPVNQSPEYDLSSLDIVFENVTLALDQIDSTFAQEDLPPRKRLLTTLPQPPPYDPNEDELSPEMLAALDEIEMLENQHDAQDADAELLRALEEIELLENQLANAKPLYPIPTADDSKYQKPMRARSFNKNLLANQVNRPPAVASANNSPSGTPPPSRPQQGIPSRPQTKIEDVIYDEKRGRVISAGSVPQGFQNRILTKHEAGSQRAMAVKPQTQQQQNDENYLPPKNVRQSFLINTSEVLPVEMIPLDFPPLMVPSMKLFKMGEECDSHDVKPILSFRENFFKTTMLHEVHLNFYGTKDSKEFTIVSVLRRPTPFGYTSVLTNKRGSNLFHIPVNSVEHKKGIQLHQSLASHLSSGLLEEGVTYTHIDDPEFAYELIKLEEKHRQNPLAFKIAILYSNGTEKVLQDYFKHNMATVEQCPGFWKFVNLVGTKIELNGWKRYRGDFVCSNTTQTSYYKEFGNIEIMYHLALTMDAEQHRRLVGNDVVFFVYHDSVLPFDPMGLDGLGTVPQVFFVIQLLPGDRYRTSLFTRPNIKEFEPKLPFSASYTADHFAQILLTKAYNGFCAAISSPPMSRLFEVPRRETIAEIVANYKLNKTKANPLREIKKRDIIRTFQDNEATQVIITVLKCRDLPAMDSNSADPFCKIRTGEQFHKTKVKYKTTSPDWGEEEKLTFSSHFIDPHSDCLMFEIWDWNKIFDSAYMGQLDLSLKTFCKDCEGAPKWYRLTAECNSASRGEIQLKFQLVGPGKAICPVCQIFIGSEDSVVYMDCSYHAACVKCQDCHVLLNGPTRKRLKRVSPNQKRDFFYCDKHWEISDFPIDQMDKEMGIFTKGPKSQSLALQPKKAALAKSSKSPGK